MLNHVLYFYIKIFKVNILKLNCNIFYSEILKELTSFIILSFQFGKWMAFNEPETIFYDIKVRLEKELLPGEFVDVGRDHEVCSKRLKYIFHGDKHVCTCVCVCVFGSVKNCKKSFSTTKILQQCPSLIVAILLCIPSFFQMMHFPSLIPPPLYSNRINTFCN